MTYEEALRHLQTRIRTTRSASPDLEAMQALAQAAIEAREQLEALSKQRLQLETLEKTIRRKGVITHREWINAHPKRGK